MALDIHNKQNIDGSEAQSLKLQAVIVSSSSSLWY